MTEQEFKTTRRIKYLVDIDNKIQEISQKIDEAREKSKNILVLNEGLHFVVINNLIANKNVKIKKDYKYFFKEITIINII